jgi:hypothetical protein
MSSNSAAPVYKGGLLMISAPTLQWGWLLITVPNLIVIGLMIIVFVIAAIVRLPGHDKQSEGK